MKGSPGSRYKSSPHSWPGLVIEALHHTDFTDSFEPVTGLTALEWAQYVLDNFKTIDEVVRFAQSVGFHQFLIPLHFLVCEKSGQCAVIEGQGQKAITITSDALKVTVLANRAWHKDYRSYERSKKTRGSLLGSQL